MADLPPTQRNRAAGIIAELNTEGFEQAEEIGRGGFGVVYRCTQPDLNRVVALKVLTSDLAAENLQRFLREQRAMGQLSGHPHIVDVFQVGTTTGGHPYLVMPYHAHGSLERRIRDSGPLDWTEVLALGVKIAGALEAAHRVGTLHRDVKPGNILLTDYGEPQLSDFGIARPAGDFQTAAGIITGSPAFTAPAILEGEAPTVASDIYGLGATLFCALTGHVAYERREGEQVLAHFLRVAAQPVPDLRHQGVPEDVCAAIEQAMARRPAERFDSAAALGEHLRGIQRRHDLPVDELPLPPASPPRIASASHSSPLRGRSTAPPTPTTKYRPPTSARSPIIRKRLLDRLRSGAGKRLTLIHAPSGFGKTTLAARWRDELCEAGGAVAWLTVDSDDDNVVWFLEHLVEAVRLPRPALAATLEHLLEQYPDDPSRHVLTALINQSHGADDPLTLVLDDWQRVTAPDTTAALRFLLEHGCHHLPLVLTSTATADLPLSRLRLSGELVEIDTDALRFDADEVRALLAEAGCLPPALDIDALTRTTDGWAVALQLAVLSLRAGDDPAQLLAALTEHADIGDYLAENVLDGLDQSTVEFLTTTSVCDRLCGGLATALTGSEAAAATLDDIEHRGLFLERVGPDRQWYRYHQLFAGYLRRRLERDRPAREIDALHLRAAAWFARHDLLNEAVDHALAAGDPDHAVELVEQGATDLLEHAKMTTLLGILAKLPASAIASRPRIQLWIAWVNLVLRRPSTPAAVALARFTAALDQSSSSEAEIADLRRSRRDRQRGRGLQRSSRQDRPIAGRCTGAARRLPPASHRRSGQYRYLRLDLPFRFRRGTAASALGDAVSRCDGTVRARVRPLCQRDRRARAARHSRRVRVVRLGPRVGDRDDGPAFARGPDRRRAAQRTALLQWRPRRRPATAARLPRIGRRGRRSGRCDDRDLCHRGPDRSGARRPRCRGLAARGGDAPGRAAGAGASGRPAAQ